MCRPSDSVPSCSGNPRVTRGRTTAPWWLLAGSRRHCTALLAVAGLGPGPPWAADARSAVCSQDRSPLQSPGVLRSRGDILETLEDVGEPHGLWSPRALRSSFSGETRCLRQREGFPTSPPSTRADNGSQVQLVNRSPLNLAKSALFEVTRTSSFTRAMAAICASMNGGVFPAAASLARSSACHSAAARS